MRPRRGWIGSGFLVLLLVAPVHLRAQDEELPVGWIQSAAKKATITFRGTRAAGALRTGDFVFRGDQLDSAGADLTLYYCPDQKSGAGVRYTLRGRLQLPDQGRLPSDALSDARAANPCLLPALERQPEVVTVPAPDKLGVQAFTAEQLSADLRDLKTAFLAAPNDLRMQLAAAVRLEQSDRRYEAAWEYYQFASKTSWQPRLLKHIQLLLEAPARVRSLMEPAAKAARPDTAGGKTFALVVGISHYEQAPLIPDLEFAARDASSLADYLRSDRGGKADVKLLLDNEATSGAIRNYFLDLKSKAGKSDTVWLFVAAHGDMLPLGNAVPAEQKVPSIITYRAHPQDTNLNSFAMQEVQNWMLGKSVPFGRAMIFLDVCHAGHLAEFRTSAGGPAADYFGIMATTQGSDAYAYESKIFDGGHGVFTYFLLRGLNTSEARLPGDTFLRAAPLSGYVYQQVQAATSFRQTPTPMVGTNQTAVVADLGKKGIDFKPIPVDQLRIPAKEMNLEHGRRGSSNAAEQEGKMAQPPVAAPADLQRIIDLEDQGEQVLLTYLRGEEVPQTPEQFSLGERIFGAALQIQPGSPYLAARESFCHGRLLVFQKNYPDAVDALEESIRLEPRAAYAYNALGIAYLEVANYSAAAGAFQDAIDRAPLWAYPRHNLALTHWQQGQYDLAVADYRAAMDRAPKYFYLPYNLGLLYATLNQQKQAEEMYRLAMKLAPGRSEPVTALGQLELAEGGRRKARKDLERATQMPGQSENALRAARHNYAVLLAKEHKTFDQAVALWKQNDDYLPSLFSLADAFAKNGQAAKAIEGYQHILALVPKSNSARLELARLMTQSRRADAEVIRVLQDGIAEDGSNAVMLEQLGMAYRDAGRREEARQALQSALDHTKDSAARRRLEKALKDLAKGHPR